ncbi:hypothetical protein UNSWDHB_1891 [Dehalobacter sp. UNSWDHB]|nr:hypothetical protein [Dehalobacter sp. UNSWDHB]EQB20818.1 hypothetical protein UNSWDHB_1891 [Dehalobacter sp. UNSWDHB]
MIIKGWERPKALDEHSQNPNFKELIPLFDATLDVFLPNFNLYELVV